VVIATVAVEVIIEHGAQIVWFNSTQASIVKSYPISSPCAKAVIQYPVPTFCSQLRNEQRKQRRNTKYTNEIAFSSTMKYTKNTIFVLLTGLLLAVIAADGDGTYDILRGVLLRCCNYRLVRHLRE